MIGVSGHSIAAQQTETIEMWVGAACDYVRASVFPNTLFKTSFPKHSNGKLPVLLLGNPGDQVGYQFGIVLFLQVGDRRFLDA